MFTHLALLVIVVGVDLTSGAQSSRCASMSLDGCINSRSSRQLCLKECEALADSDPTSVSQTAKDAADDAGGSKPASSDGTCFSGDTTVQTQEGDKLMELVEIGDNILTFDVKTGEFGYDRVVFWSHRDTEMTSMFKKITLVSGGSITLSSDHLIYVGECSKKIPSVPKFAHSATIEQCLFTKKEGATKIVSIMDVQLQGAYAPLTEKGTIVVNGVIASCYSATESAFMSALFHKFLRLAVIVYDRLDVFGIIPGWFHEYGFVAAGRSLVY